MTMVGVPLEKRLEIARSKRKFLVSGVLAIILLASVVPSAAGATRKIIFDTDPGTDDALALLKDPSIVPLVKEVILMGGSISGGNVNAVAEANIYNDPDAAQIVFQAGWPLTMVGLDVGDKTLFSRKHLAQLATTHGPINDF